MAQRWHASVAAAPRPLPAGQLYKGRSISDATAVSQALCAELHIVSAGLGLISAADQAPNYNLTIAPGTVLANALARCGQGPADWWRVLNTDHPAPLASLLEAKHAYIALPATYLRMIHEDLALVPRGAIEQLRIFTSVAGRAFVPEHLVECVMPYDERLETVSGSNGTRVDFPQRAMRHFVDTLEGHRTSLNEGRSAVAAFMNTKTPRAAPVRARATDEELNTLLRRHWEECGGSRTRLLRYLRDMERVSCEQGRFQRLWKAVAEKLADA